MDHSQQPCNQTLEIVKRYSSDSGEALLLVFHFEILDACNVIRLGYQRGKITANSTVFMACLVVAEIRRVPVQRKSQALEEDRHVFDFLQWQRALLGP